MFISSFIKNSIMLDVERFFNLHMCSNLVFISGLTKAFTCGLFVGIKFKNPLDKVVPPWYNVIKLSGTTVVPEMFNRLLWVHWKPSCWSGPGEVFPAYVETCMCGNLKTEYR